MNDEQMLDADQDTIPLKVEGKKEPIASNPISKKQSLGILAKPLLWQISSIVLLIIVIVMWFSRTSSPSGFSTADIISKEEAKQKVQDYINLVLQDRSSLAVLGEITNKKGLYNILIDIDGQLIDSYVTLDGELFFPNVVDIDRTLALGAAIEEEPVTNEQPNIESPGAEEAIVEEN